METDTPGVTEASPPPFTRCYRVRRYFLVIGVVATAFFFVADCVSVAAAAWNIDGSFPNPTAMASLMAVIWTPFVLLGIWLIVSYFRQRLHIRDATLTKTGILGERTIALADVRRARWRLFPASGSIVIHSATEKIKIDFGDYPPHDAREMIDFLRESINQDLQEGWPRFANSILRKTPVPSRQARDTTP